MTGVPLYFTIWAENSSGTRSKATCSLPTYDVTVPTGRLTADFTSTSNPAVLRASVVVIEDSALSVTQVGVGYGKGVYGDQVVPWTDANITAGEIMVSKGTEKYRDLQYV